MLSHAGICAGLTSTPRGARGKRVAVDMVLVHPTRRRMTGALAVTVLATLAAASAVHAHGIVPASLKGVKAPPVPGLLSGQNPTSAIGRARSRSARRCSGTSRSGATGWRARAATSTPEPTRA
jgi:hypothetical protein